MSAPTYVCAFNGEREDCVERADARRREDNPDEWTYPEGWLWRLVANKNMSLSEGVNSKYVWFCSATCLLLWKLNNVDTWQMFDED